MKSTSRFVLFLISLVSLFSFNSCFQYPEGPIFTLETRDERLEGTWAVISVHDAGGADITSEFTDWTLTVEVDRSGNRTWSMFINSVLSDLGTYQFTENNDYLVVIFTVLGGFEANAIQKFYTIRKLTDKEFIYIDELDREFEWKKY